GLRGAAGGTGQGRPPDSRVPAGARRAGRDLHERHAGRSPVRVASLFGKLDDWLNPIVVKELRQAVRSRVVVAALMLFLLLQLGLFGVYALTTEASQQHESEVFSAGRQIFRVLQGILLGTCLLVPAYAGLRLGAERSDTNVDLLFISTLRPRAIV